MFDFDKMTDKQKIKFVMGNHQRMVDKRKDVDGLTQKIVEIFNPRRYSILGNKRKGQQYGFRVYDGKPEIALNKYVRGFLGYMMSRAVPWLAFTSSDTSVMKDDSAKKYMQEASEQMLGAFNSTNIYDQSLPFAKDGSSIGTATMIPQEDLAAGKMRYTTIDPDEVYIEDDWVGNPAIYHRELELTAMTALEEFGEDNLPKKIVRDAKGETTNANPFALSKYIYSVYRNANFFANSLRPRHKKYRVLWILRSTGTPKEQLVMDTGTSIFPIVWRMLKEAGWPYGTSLCADGLTTAMFTNQLSKKVMLAAHLAVQPATAQSAELRGKVHMGPDGRTYLTKDNQKVEITNDGRGWNIGDAERERLDSMLDDIFFIRFFEQLTGKELPRMTAFQVSQMQGEKAVLMGSIVDSFERDFLNNIIDIQWDFETRAGRMPEVPAVLAETDGVIDTIFLGPLAQLQRSLLQTKNILDGLAIAGTVGSLNPASMVVVKWDKTMEDALVGNGFPQGNIRSDEEIAAIRQAEAEAIEEQQQLETAETIAKATPSVSKDIEPNSPLSILGVG